MKEGGGLVWVVMNPVFNVVLYVFVVEGIE